MNDLKRLLDILNDELKEQDQLLKLLVKERAAIVKLNQDEADALLPEKQRLLERVQGSEQKREKILAERSPAPAKMSDLIAGCKEPTLKRELTVAQRELKVLATRVREMNSSNAELLQQALGVIASTLAIVRSAPTAEPATYGKNGAMKDDLGEAALLRRRVVTTSA